MNSDPVDGDRLAELEEERLFLLNSIRDLDREREVGDVTSDDFDALRDGYVARAAAVLREIDGGHGSKVSAPARNWNRRLAIIGLTLVVAVGLGVFVARSAGQRLPGQGLTGGQPADEVAVQLAEGRRLMNLGHFDDSGLVYERVLQLEPDNIEARTYSAWIDLLVAVDSAAVQESLTALSMRALLMPPTPTRTACSPRDSALCRVTRLWFARKRRLFALDLPPTWCR